MRRIIQKTFDEIRHIYIYVQDIYQGTYTQSIL